MVAFYLVWHCSLGSGPEWRASERLGPALEGNMCHTRCNNRSDAGRGCPEDPEKPAKVVWILTIQEGRKNRYLVRHTLHCSAAATVLTGSSVPGFRRVSKAAAWPFHEFPLSKWEAQCMKVSYRNSF